MGEGIFPLISSMHKITWSLGPPPPSIDCWRALALVAERQIIHKQLRLPKKRVWTFSWTPNTEIKKYTLLILPVVAYPPCVSSCPGIKSHCFIISLEAPRFKASQVIEKAPAWQVTDVSSLQIAPNLASLLHIENIFHSEILKKQARKPRATLVWNYDSLTDLLTYLLTRVKCRATSVAKNTKNGIQ